MYSRLRLICVRHGESEGNRERRFCATPEVPLTPLGRRQARAAALSLRAQFAPQRIVSSPYRRAQETATIIASVLRLPVEIDPALRERNIGVYAGQPYEAVLADPSYQSQPFWQWQPPQGESLAEVVVRVLPAITRLASDITAGDVVLVTHAGVLAALRASAQGGSWESVHAPRNGEILVFEYVNGSLVFAQAPILPSFHYEH